MITPDDCEHGREEPSVCLCGAAPEGTYPAGYLDEIRQQLDALAAGYGDGDLSLSEWRATSKPLVERLRQIEEAHLSPGEAPQKSAADIGRDLVEVVADYASDRVWHAEWLILREGLKERNRRTSRTPDLDMHLCSYLCKGSCTSARASSI